MKKALIIGQLIANAYPGRVHLLFKAHGITAQPSGKSIMDAYLVLGEPFLHDLFNIAYSGIEQYSGLFGLETDKLSGYKSQQEATASTLEAKKTKSGFWNGFKNTFKKAGNILTSVGGAYSSIEDLLRGTGIIDTGTKNATEADLELQKQLMELQMKQQQAAQNARLKNILLIGGGLLLAGLLAVMIIRLNKR